MRTVKCFFLLLAMLVTGSLSLRAQTASSAIVLGRIVDASGAVVPDAQLTLRSVATNATRQQKSNNVGQYVFSAVPPGAYLLTVTKSGFETATLNDLQLDVNKSYTVDVPLTIGSQSQAVEVSTSSTVVELQTTDSTIGNVIGSRELLRLPTQSRDATELLNLQPGAMQGVSQNGGDTFSTTGGAVAGSRPDQNVMSLDGIDVTPNASFGAAFKPVFPLNVDAVSEFRVGITNPNSTFGIAAGAQESVTSRSGTNAFHGVGYWYNQNTAFNANDWDSNLTGQPRPHIVDNRVGTAVGGPIKKDKTFFFFNYEDRRFSQAIRTEKLVPSADLRNGYLSFPDATGNLVKYNLQQYDPRGIGISPTIQKMWNMMPQGNDPGAGDGVNILGYLQNIAARRQDDNVSLKLDHQFSSKLHFFGRYQFYRDLDPGALGQTDLLPAANGGAATFVGQQPTFGDGATAGLDWIIQPTLISSLHFGEIRYREGNTPVLGPQIATQLNLPGTSSLDGPVVLQVANYPDSNPYRLDQPIDNVGGGRKIDSTSYQIREDLNWTKGKHNFAFGGLYLWLPVYVKSDNRIQGPTDAITAVIDGDQNALFITNPADRPPPTLLPPTFVPNWDRLYASALGMLDSTTVAVARDANLNPLPAGTPFIQNTVQRQYYFYGQDTWRFKPNLTLSYGLAYGWNQPPTEAQGKMMVLVDSNGKLIDSASYLANRESAALNGQIYNPTIYHEPYGKAGLSHAWNTDWTDWSPRMSLAWNPSANQGFWGWLLGEHKTVIRGGYGISYDRNLYITEALTSTGFGQSFTNALPLCNDPVARPGAGCNPASTDPALSSFRVGVDGPNIPAPPADVKYPLPYAEGINGIPADFWDFEMDPNYKNGRNHNFDLSIQREFAHSNIVEIGYVGRLARRLPTDVSLTTPPYMFKDITTVSGAKGSGQSFAQAFDALAMAVRNGCGPSVGQTPCPTEPWFEDQLPAGWGASPANCGPGFNNSQCLASQQPGNFISGNVLGLFGVAGQGGINGIRLAAGLPSFSNTQQADLLMHESYDKSNYNAMTVTWRNNNWAGIVFDLNYTFSKCMDNGGRIQVFANGLDNAFNPHADYGPCYFDRTHTFNGTFAYELPFGKGHSLSGNKFVNGVIGGWYVGGIYTAATGVPLIATESFAYGGGFITTNPVGEIPTVSNIPTGLHYIGNGVNLFGTTSQANQVFSEFRPILLASDNTSGRDNPFRGFPNWNLDFRLGKQMNITERVHGELSADFFNLFNHPNFNDPGAGAAQGGLDLTSGPGNFGTSTSSAIPGNRIGGARWVQMGLRISF